MASINAVDEAIRGLNGIPFVDFTRTLIDGVFDALLDAQLKQTESFQELLEAVSVDLATYLKTTTQDVSADDTLAFLQALPEVRGHGAVEFAGRSQALPAALAGAQRGRASVDLTLTNEALAALRDRLVIPDVDNALPAAIAADGTRPATVAVPSAALFSAVAQRIAANRYSLLTAMVDRGLSRLVVDHGEIETRFVFSSFQRDTADERLTSRNRNVSASETSEESGTVTGGGFGLGALIGNVGFGGGLGGGSSRGRSSATRRSALSVRTLDERHRDVSGGSVKFHSRVKINFKTDFLPLGS
ncbi:MAG: hypothetical protein AAF360_05915 [Pseudomonadota bacterium]